MDTRSFLGHPVEGGPPRLELLLTVPLPHGRTWRLYCGNAAGALAVAHTGVIPSSDGGTPFHVTHVVNTAAAETPARYFNTRGSILYANVLTRDWPVPEPDSPQRPNWLPALRLVEASLVHDDSDPTLLIHCMYGRNRSVTTCCIVLRLAFPSRFPSFDAALAHISALKRTEVFDVYRAWARALLGEEGGAAPPTFRTLALPPTPSLGATGGAWPPTRKGAMALLLREEPGVCVGGVQPSRLCALLIREKLSYGGGVCAPLESNRDGETAPECAARALDEELLHTGCVTSAAVSRFVHVELRAVHVFVGTSAELDVAALTPARFQDTLATIRAARAAGAVEWRGVPIKDHCETTECLLVDVASMLVAPDGGLLLRDVHQQPLCDGGGADGILRPFFAEVLRETRLQAVLRDALEAFNERVLGNNLSV